MFATTFFYTKYKLHIFIISALVISGIIVNNLLFYFFIWQFMSFIFWKYSDKNIKTFLYLFLSDYLFLLSIILIYISVDSFDLVILREKFYSISSFDGYIIAFIVSIAVYIKSFGFPFFTIIKLTADDLIFKNFLIIIGHVFISIFLLIKLYFFIELIKNELIFLSILSAISVFLYASIAAASNNLSRIFIFSTLSQTGFILSAIFLRAYEFAFLYLVFLPILMILITLGVNNILKTTNEYNIYKLGKLYNKLKPTADSLLVAFLSLACMFPLMGYFTSYSVLEVAFNESQYIIWTILTISIFISSFYAFRVFVLCFFSVNEFKEEFFPIKSKFNEVGLYILSVLVFFLGIFSSSILEQITLLPKYIITTDFNLNLALSFTYIMFSSIFIFFGIYRYSVIMPSKKSFLHKFFEKECYLNKGE